jgi:hypothetical protein
MTDRELMQQALEKLEFFAHMKSVSEGTRRLITALRQALETEQEPCEFWSVAEGWVKIDEVREHFDAVGCGTIYKSAGEGRSPLYTAPQKQWVGLTADEIWKCNRSEAGNAVEFHICYAHQNVEDFAEAIEAKLKEKNT